MPTYEFRCPQGHSFDKFFRTMGAATSEMPCPECGETAARQISGGAGFQFKGSGFYLTDYGKNAHRTSGDAKPSAKPSATGESKGETKSESKSESKGESKSSGTSSGGSSSGGSSSGGSSSGGSSSGASKSGDGSAS